MRISSKFLGEQLDFERESYLEGFIFGNPLILATSQDAPENLVPVYIIGRQEICKLDKSKRGITDLICLIWEPNLEKYEIWIYELKVYSSSEDDVKQLEDYLNAIETNKDHINEIIERAKEMVGNEFVINPNIRGALCAQSFSDNVMNKILEVNESRNEKIVAVRIYRFPIDNDVFVLVERLIGEEKSPTGGKRTYYEDIPDWNENKLENELFELLRKRKENYEERYKQLKVFLELFVDRPDKIVTQNELKEQWKKEGLPEQDRGLSVSQLLGYKNSGALRQILKWKTLDYMDIKENYQLRDSKYSNVIKNAIKKLNK